MFRVTRPYLNLLAKPKNFQKKIILKSVPTLPKMFRRVTPNTLILKKNGLRIFQKSGLFTSDYGKTVKTQWKPPKITLNN